MTSKTSAWSERLGGLRTRFLARHFDLLGAGANFRGAPTIINHGQLRVGRDFRFSSWPARSHIAVGEGAVVDFGDGVVISHGAAFSAQLAIAVGEGSHFGPFASVMDSDFHVVGDRNALPELSPVRIGKNVKIGSHVTILRGSTLGDGAEVLSGSVVSGQVGPGEVVSGVPARVATSFSGNEDVIEVVTRTLALPERPERSDGPGQLKSWDSLGALKLLLALEDAFAITLQEEDVAHARSVAELEALVERTLQKGARARVG